MWLFFCPPFKNKHLYATLPNAAAATAVVKNENYPQKVSLNAACGATGGVMRCASFGLLVARHKSAFTNFIKIFAPLWKPKLPSRLIQVFPSLWMSSKSTSPVALEGRSQQLLQMQIFFT